MKTRFLLLLTLLLCIMLVFGCAQSLPSDKIASAEAPTPIFTWVLTILLLFVISALFILPLTHSSYGEIVAVIVIILVLLFYYTQPISTWLSNLQLGASTAVSNDDFPQFISRAGHTLGNLLFEAQRFVLTHLPEKTILIGSVTILRLETKSLFEPTRWPVFILLIGGFIRVAVARYVKNDRLRHATGEYWLYLLAYLV